MKKLPTRAGFPVDLRDPGIDKVAIDQCNRQFGRDVVDSVLSRFHRAKLSEGDIVENVKKFDRKYCGANRDAIYHAVLQSVIREFVPSSPLIPLTTGAAVAHKDLPKDKSPGLPWRNNGYRTKGDVLDVPENVDYIRRRWSKIGNLINTTLPDTLIFHRAQICSTEKNKLRPVFGYPLEVFIEEVRFLYPYMEWLNSDPRDRPVAYGLEMVHGGMSYIDKMAKGAPYNSSIVMTDWSSFDSTVPPWLIRDAFSILRRSFHFDRVISSDGKIWEVDASVTERRWKRLINYFINTPIRFSSGDRFSKHGGVPSGSGFTNLIDTIVNAIVTRYICYQCTGSLPYGDVYMGDDAVVVVDGIVNLDDWAKLAERNFGMKLGLEKSWVTNNPDNIHFLGYYNRSGVAYKPQDTIVASFIYPERKPEDVQTTCSRALGQLWSSLNGIDATHWLEIVERIISEHDLDPEFVVDYLNKYPNRFRFLRQMGIDPRSVGIPRRTTYGRVTNVEPPDCPPRNFRPRCTNLHRLYLEYLECPLFLDSPANELPEPQDE